MIHAILEEQRRYLADASRLGAYRRALEELVVPGSVVLDLGAGTGILGLLACRAGARRVYSVDRGGIIELAREIGERSGFGDRIRFIRGASTDVTLPEMADLVVADQAGFLGHEAGLLAFFDDAAKRHLKPGGRLVPSALDLFVAPVDSSASWAPVGFWGGRQEGFDFQHVRRRAENTCFLARLGRAELLGEGLPARSVDLGAHGSTVLDLESEVAIRRAGILHGIAGWWRARLSPGVTMSNAPGEPDAIDRPQAFFPIGRPAEVSEGDRVRIRVRIRSTDLVSWKVRLARKRRSIGRAGASDVLRFEHSTFKSLLVSREEVRSGRPDHVPSLNPLGLAARDVLRLCDGRTSVAEIETAIARLHPGLFRAPGEASAFVSRIAGECCVPPAPCDDPEA